MTNIIAIILTLNESKHIKRCIESVFQIANIVYVVDSNSQDNTVEIAKSLGARVLINNWKNHSTQFNWALDQINTTNNTWILRIDADEIIDQSLVQDIREISNRDIKNINGYYCKRSIIFQGKKIKWGGWGNAQSLRFFRFKHGKCEQRWMDEHIIVKGDIGYLKGEIIDNNLNSLTWWVQKHNLYASREAVDLLNIKFKFDELETIASLKKTEKNTLKRWVKENIYFFLPLGIRSLLFFFYRYIILIGFFDGRIGFTFHFLQGFWYRNLVDLKYQEVLNFMKKNNSEIKEAIYQVLNIRI